MVRNICLLLTKFLLATVLGCCALVVSADAFGRKVATIDDFRKKDTPIILAEIVETKPATSPPPRAGSAGQKGYSLELNVHEVLHGELDASRIHIPFSSKEYGGVWEFGSEPKVGMKLLVYLTLGSGQKWELIGAGSVVALNEFDDPLVVTTRRIIEFWKIEDLQKKQNALRRGCFDKDPGFRSYCIRTIIDEAYDDRFRERTASMLNNRAYLWKVYNDPRTSLDDIVTCDSYFRNTFRGLGWYTFEPRYEIILETLQRHLASDASRQVSRFGYLVEMLCKYTTHREETLALLMEATADQRDIYKFIAVKNLHRLYVLTPRGQEAERFNQKLLQQIVGYLDSPEDDTAKAAAYALTRLHKRFAELGFYSNKLYQLTDGARNHSDGIGIRNVLGRGLEIDGLQEITEALNSNDAPLLISGNWDDYIGKTVRMVGKKTFKHAEGISIEIGTRLLWLPAGTDLETGRRLRIVLKGTLDVAYDIPAFRYEDAEGFKDGLPVPAPYEVEDIQKRYLLRNPDWTIH